MIVQQPSKGTSHMAHKKPSYTTRKQVYLFALSTQPASWVARSAANPSAGMTRMHVALHLIDLRRRFAA